MCTLIVLEFVLWFCLLYNVISVIFDIVIFKTLSIVHSRARSLYCAYVSMYTCTTSVVQCDSLQAWCDQKKSTTHHIKLSKHILEKGFDKNVQNQFTSASLWIRMDHSLTPWPHFPNDHTWLAPPPPLALISLPPDVTTAECHCSLDSSLVAGFIALIRRHRGKRFMWQFEPISLQQWRYYGPSQSLSLSLHPISITISTLRISRLLDHMSTIFKWRWATPWII